MTGVSDENEGSRIDCQPKSKKVNEERVEKLLIHTQASLWFSVFDRIEADIISIKKKFSDLQRKNQRMGEIVGPGAAKGSELIEIICSNCDDVVNALSKGVDNEGFRINTTQISDGLKKLVDHARHDTGVVAIQLNPEGVHLYSEYLNQLDRIADTIHRIDHTEMSVVKEAMKSSPPCDS